MSESPGPILHYHGPKRRDPSGRRDPGGCGPASIGFLVGSAISLIAYFGFNPLAPETMLVAICLKVALAIAFMLIPGWAGFAAGLLFSVFAGLLIWVGSCFANFKI